MGIRLVKYGVASGGAGTYNHNELIGKDLPDQHPISAITGLEDRLANVEKGNNSNILEITQENHKMEIGNVVYGKDKGVYDKAFAEDSKRIEAIGIVTEIIDENNFIVTFSGQFETDLYDEYPNGTALFLSDTNIGVLTNSPLKYAKPIGVKIESGILINVQRASTYVMQHNNDDDDIELYYTEEEIINAINEIW